MKMDTEPPFEPMNQEWKPQVPLMLNWMLKLRQPMYSLDINFTHQAANLVPATLPQEELKLYNQN